MSKHTPGPWIAEPDTFFAAEVYDDGTQICPISKQPFGGKMVIAGVSHRRNAAEAAANARLITAAPDFLAACTGPDPDVTALSWLSAFLTEIDRNLGTLMDQSEDREALYHAYSESCRLLRGLQAARAKALGEEHR